MKTKTLSSACPSCSPAYRPPRAKKARAGAALEQKEWDRIKDSIYTPAFRTFLNAFAKGANAAGARKSMGELTAIEAKEGGRADLSCLKGGWGGAVNERGRRYEVKLDIRNDQYLVEYPLLSCRGDWVLVEKGDGWAVFTEKLHSGSNSCRDGGKVVLQRKGGAQILFQYFRPDAVAPVATSLLDKKSP